LLFYARLKGVAPDLEEERVTRAIKEVQLERERDMLTKKLPLGMKRRLSIAIALVADPKIVFLDEPTTGLDPETRRQLWNILQECRNGRALVLTTHSMEEADVLCNRIGIVSDGVLKCIGSQMRLKNLYGGGYHLFVNSQKAKYLKQLQERRERAKMRKRSSGGSSNHSRIRS
jgi:ABC-type multidrug transport system ATPase subunit